MEEQGPRPPAESQRVAGIVAAALEQHPSGWPEYLRSTCGSVLGLEEQVLAALEEALAPAGRWPLPRATSPAARRKSGAPRSSRRTR